jgi:hypothetical protein
MGTSFFASSVTTVGRKPRNWRFDSDRVKI